MTDEITLLQRRFALAEHARAVYFATVEQHITPENVLQPGFWRHIASQLKPYDEVVVANDDCSWRMQLVVADAWHNGARLVELSRADMAGKEEEDLSLGDDLRVRWRGPVNKWCVVRTSDGVILRANLPDKNVAMENLTAIAKAANLSNEAIARAGGQQETKWTPHEMADEARDDGRSSSCASGLGMAGSKLAKRSGETCGDRQENGGRESQMKRSFGIQARGRNALGGGNIAAAWTAEALRNVLAAKGR